MPSCIEQAEPGILNFKEKRAKNTAWGNFTAFPSVASESSSAEKGERIESKMSGSLQQILLVVGRLCVSGSVHVCVHMDA